VAVALAWLTATLLAPAHDRPYAIGSTNGSAWNAAFVFNGTDRLGAKSPEPQQTVYEPGYHYPVATQEERDHIPILPPSATRLLARVGPLSGERLGLELLIGLLLGVPALIAGVLADRRMGASAATATATANADPPDPSFSALMPGSDDVATAADAEIGPTPRLRLASAVCLIVWNLTGIVLFSKMIRLHPRYVEGFMPAVAALLGIGIAWSCSTGAGGRGKRSLDDLARLAALALALAVTVVYVELLEYGRTGVWWVSLACALEQRHCRRTDIRRERRRAGRGRRQQQAPTAHRHTDRDHDRADARVRAGIAAERRRSGDP
jgi:hypothetical protein